MRNMQKNMEMSMEDNLFDIKNEEEFLTFQSFTDFSIAKSVSEKLSENYIECRVERETPALDSIIGGAGMIPFVLIKIKSADFLRAHKSLEDYYKKEINAIEASYYLFDFSDEELFDILKKPDEWGPLDYQLAQKILLERGKEVSFTATQQLKEERILELSKPVKADSLIATAYVFIVYVFASILLMRINDTYNFPYSIFLILLAGNHLTHGKKTLPDGKQSYLFEYQNRKSGVYISIIGLTFLVYTIVTIIWVASNFSYGLFDFSL